MAFVVAKLLKTKLEKMSESPLPTMLMKISLLRRSFHDVDDKKELIENGANRSYGTRSHD